MDEELISRQQPQSLEAEQAVLGSILIDSQRIFTSSRTGKFTKPSTRCSTFPRPSTRSLFWIS